MSTWGYNRGIYGTDHELTAQNQHRVRAHENCTPERCNFFPSIYNFSALHLSMHMMQRCHHGTIALFATRHHTIIGHSSQSRLSQLASKDISRWPHTHSRTRPDPTAPCLCEVQDSPGLFKALPRVSGAGLLNGMSPLYDLPSLRSLAISSLYRISSAVRLRPTCI